MHFQEFYGKNNLGDIRFYIWQPFLENVRAFGYLDVKQLSFIKIVSTNADTLYLIKL